MAINEFKTSGSFLISIDEPDVCELADIVRGYSVEQIEAVERVWSHHRTRLGPSSEHAHWDWQWKTRGERALEYYLVGVECRDRVQGLMAIQRMPRTAREDVGPLLYVDYLESAPWNLGRRIRVPRFKGVGLVLVREAVIMSFETGFEGVLGLHSLPGAEQTYKLCGMKDCGPDPDFENLKYFEFSRRAALRFLESSGVIP